MSFRENRLDISFSLLADASQGMSSPIYMFLRRKQLKMQSAVNSRWHFMSYISLNN